jgi:hypothetical protein
MRLRKEGKQRGVRAVLNLRASTCLDTDSGCGLVVYVVLAQTLWRLTGAVGDENAMRAVCVLRGKRLPGFPLLLRRPAGKERLCGRAQ